MTGDTRVLESLGNDLLVCPCSFALNSQAVEDSHFSNPFRAGNREAPSGETGGGESADKGGHWYNTPMMPTLGHVCAHRMCIGPGLRADHELLGSIWRGGGAETLTSRPFLEPEVVL